MSDAEVVRRTKGYPATVRSLTADLEALGVAPGMTLLVHSSLTSLGWVCGGAVAVILALENALGLEGTLVMPAHSGGLSDPAGWSNPPVPSSWWPVIRQTMPAFDADLTPTRGVGLIPECFRKQKGVLRSSHPSVSFAARGPCAAQVVADHGLDFGLGENSPLARLYDLEGWVLLLGVGYESNTSLHLAEYRADFRRRTIESGAPVRLDGRRQWVVYQDVDFDESDFSVIGERFGAESGRVRLGRVAGAAAQLMPQRPLVDYAVKWMEANR